MTIFWVFYNFGNSTYLQSIRLVAWFMISPLDLSFRNVHSRSAAKVTVATMRERGWWSAAVFLFTRLESGWMVKPFLFYFPSGITRALLHNFAGKPAVALEGMKAGYLFSFPPAVCRNQQVCVSCVNHCLEKEADVTPSSTSYKYVCGLS